MRIRTVKPELWSSAPVVRCSLRARLLFVGLLNYADDEGRGLADPPLIRGALFPLELAEVSDEDVLEWLQELHRNGLVTLYRGSEDGHRKARNLLEIDGFLEHQVISHPRPSRYPAPRKRRRRSGNGSGRRSRKSSVRKGSGMEQGKEVEVSGAGSPPSAPAPLEEKLLEHRLRDQGETPLFEDPELEPAEPSSEPRPSPAAWRDPDYNPWSSVPPGKTIADLETEAGS